MAEMTVQIPEEIAVPVEALSRRLGIPPRELVLTALRAHFMAPDAELQAELDAWEMAAEEDAARIEAAEGIA